MQYVASSQPAMIFRGVRCAGTPDVEAALTDVQWRLTTQLLQSIVSTAYRRYEYSHLIHALRPSAAWPITSMGADQRRLACISPMVTSAPRPAPSCTPPPRRSGILRSSESS